MSAGPRDTLEAIDRWERDALIDAGTAALLRGEVAETAEVTTKRLSQYVLASTGAMVLIIAGWLFLDWAWPLLGEGARVYVLGAVGVGVMIVGGRKRIVVFPSRFLEELGKCCRQLLAGHVRTMPVERRHRRPISLAVEPPAYAAGEHAPASEARRPAVDPS